jgi:hypothetical protein
MWKSRLVFLLLLLSLSSCSSACFITIDDVDMTDELFVEDNSNGGGYLNCTGNYRCRDAIMACEKIHCAGAEACEGAVIEFTESVTCVGLHACHHANLTHSPSATREMKPSLHCEGNGACDVSTIYGPEQLRVSCFGGKACRKAMITAKSIHCTQGSSAHQACQGFASLTTECLVCGFRGCADHINQCRYKILSGEQEDYLPCQPGTLHGTCDSQLQQAFEQELSGEEQGNEGEEGV